MKRNQDIENFTMALFIVFVLMLLAYYTLGIFDYVSDSRSIMLKYQEQKIKLELCNDDVPCMIRESEELFNFINKIEKGD